MKTSDVLAIERLLSDFAWFADRADGDSLAALFVSDAVLTVGGSDLKGREAISDDCRRRFANGTRKTRHLWSNLRIEHSESDEISSTALQMTFEQSHPEQPTQLRLNDIADWFRRDADGSWRFARRIIKREMAMQFPP